MSASLHKSLSLGLLAVPATLGGWLAAWLGVPLAWLVGAMLVTACLSLAGVSAALPQVLYRAGQVVIAVAVGLTVSTDIAARILPHLPLILIAALGSVVAGRLLSPILVRWGGLSPATAHFSMVPAGIAEMAELAGRRGADVGAVATFHALRVMMVVILLPLALMVGVGAADMTAIRVQGGVAGPDLLLALILGLAAAIVAARLRMPAAFLVAPMLAISLLSGAGVLQAQMPPVALAAAQVALGMALGARFDRATLMRLPRALRAGLPTIILHGAVMAGLALVLARISGFDPLLLVLGLATGGAAEMVLTAKILAADAAMVAAYQVTRGLVGNLLADAVYKRTVQTAERRFHETRRRENATDPQHKDTSE